MHRYPNKFKEASRGHIPSVVSSLPGVKTGNDHKNFGLCGVLFPSSLPLIPFLSPTPLQILCRLWAPQSSHAVQILCQGQQETKGDQILDREGDGLRCVVSEHNCYP